MSGRDVAWGGLHNARDLGGLPRDAGGTTRPGRVFRAPRLDDLGVRGWAELAGAGVRTIVDLRNDDEQLPAGEDAGPRGGAPVEIVSRPVEDPTDESFLAVWGRRLGSPAYYPEVLDRWPGLVDGALDAIADAPPGSVVIHCAVGRDRTGMIAAMLLAECGVDRRAILDDYELGVRATNDWLLQRPFSRERPRLGDELEEAVAEARGELEIFLALLVGHPLRQGSDGRPSALARAAARLIDPSPDGAAAD